MTAERIKEIQMETAYPNSMCVQQALFKVWNECVQSEQSKVMEKEQKQRFNKFLNDEMELGISDKKTIERIHWYYNNYLLTFKSE